MTRQLLNDIKMVILCFQVSSLQPTTAKVRFPLFRYSSCLDKVRVEIDDNTRRYLYATIHIGYTNSVPIPL